MNVSQMIARNPVSNKKNKKTNKPRTKVEPKLKKTDECCALCLENLVYNNRKIYTTECGHTFHTMCFNKITSKHLDECCSCDDMKISCPYCRSSVSLEPKNKLAKLRKNFKDMKYMVLCEEMKIHQSYGYGQVLHEIDEIRTEMNKLLENASNNMPLIMRFKYNLNCRKNEINYIREVARNHTFAMCAKLRVMKESIETLVNAKN